jgi:riboflavin transporter FmnP
MANRAKFAVAERRRDVFDWVGVAVNIVQAAVYVAALIGVLYWYIARGGGMPAVLVGLSVTTIILLLCNLYALASVRKKSRL